MKQINTIANAITGAAYPFEPPAEIQRVAKDCGIVIVFGSSDDLMEFRGAIYEELGAYDGGVAHLSPAGLVVNECENEDCPHHARAKAKAATIRAVWNDAAPYWTYDTDIPHATFEVMEGGEVYCRGIVFDLAEVMMDKGNEG